MAEPTSRRYRNISGPEIRRLRDQAGLSQEQLAGRLQLAGLDHMDRVTVAKIESQIRSVYDWELLVMASVLGVGLADFEVSKKELKRELPDLVKGKID